MINIGCNTTISTNVHLLTHDASIGAIIGREKYSDILGRIQIGNNCFIGNNCIIMYGVTLPDKTIVASGSVVTKSVDSEGMILAGNPAKIIGKVDTFLHKRKNNFFSLHGLSYDAKKQIVISNPEMLVKK